MQIQVLRVVKMPYDVAAWVRCRSGTATVYLDAAAYTELDRRRIKKHLPDLASTSTTPLRAG